MARMKAAEPIAPVTEIADDGVKSQAVATRAQCMQLAKIETDQQFEQAAELLRECAKARAVVKAHMDPICDAAHKAWKVTTEKRNELLNPIDQAENHLRGIRSEYQRRIADENRRAQEEALRKQREAEEAQRAAYEKAQKAAAKKGAVPPPAPEPIAPVVVPPVARELPKSAGVASTKVYKFEVIDFSALVKAVAAGQVDINYLLPNEKLLGANVKVLKDGFSLPGVRVFEDFVDRVSGR